MKAKIPCKICNKNLNNSLYCNICCIRYYINNDEFKSNYYKSSLNFSNKIIFTGVSYRSGDYELIYSLNNNYIKLYKKTSWSYKYDDNLIFQGEYKILYKNMIKKLNNLITKYSKLKVFS